MNAKEKINQLQKLIIEQLSSLINHDYWLLNVPYHTNVGDVLIWQGEEDFLNLLPYQCKGRQSYDSPVPEAIPEDDLILIHGGGNFGDIWPIPHKWQMNVVEKYPNNRIIFLPQTIWFQKEENIRLCSQLLSRHANITICARDNVSYNILKRYFSNNILLVPDMAFCIDIKSWDKPTISKEDLLLMRSDMELKNYTELNDLISQRNIKTSDWLTFTEESWQKTWFRRTKKYAPFMYDWYAYNIFRPYIVNSGVKFIGAYNKIYSTRLHAAILSILLEKASDLIWFDNSYGKNSSFYETWLSDLTGITFIK